MSAVRDGPRAVTGDNLMDKVLRVENLSREGILSRIGGQISGSCVTFGTLGKTSAPGQIPLEDLTAILDKIAENLE